MKGIVFGFGRLSPPTTGHERLVQKIVEVAKKTKSDHMLYLSLSHDNETNPLEWNFKRNICQAAFPGLNISNDPTMKNPFQVLESFIGKYEDVTLVLGSDRVESFTKSMVPYAEKWGLNLNIISAGQRIDESGCVAGISASKLREFAINGNKQRFMKHLPSRLSSPLREMVYQKTKEGLQNR